MSAFLCSPTHISLIVNAHPDPSLRNGQSFQLLLAENLRSLEARYPGRYFLNEWKSEAERFRFVESDPKAIVLGVYAEAGISKRLTVAQVRAQTRKACDCFDYQACETDDYYTTLAACFVKEVRKSNYGREALEKDALWSL